MSPWHNPRPCRLRHPRARRCESHRLRRRHGRLVHHTDAEPLYGPEYKQALSICGSKSGRDCDKVKEAGLTPYFTDGTAAFEEASMVFVCRKLYEDEIKPENFIAKENDGKWYPEKDYHTVYIAEITKVLVKE